MLMDDRASVITTAQYLFDAVTVHMGLPKESRFDHEAPSASLKC
jgi:hypothetical protein